MADEYLSKGEEVYYDAGTHEITVGINEDGQLVVSVQNKKTRLWVFDKVFDTVSEKFE
jgi:hypothetical protein